VSKEDGKGCPKQEGRMNMQDNGMSGAENEQCRIVLGSAGAKPNQGSAWFRLI